MADLLDPAGQPAFVAPMPARNVACTRCGSLVPEIDAFLTRHLAWHLEPETIPSVSPDVEGPVVGNLAADDPGIRRA